MKVPAVYAITGLIILAGFAGKALFRKTRIPDIPLLLGIGVLLGPVLDLISSEVLLPLAPYVGTIALLMIMLEGGMNLDVDRVVRQMKWISLLTSLAFLLATAGIAAVLHFYTGMSITLSLILGAALGCTSGAVVIPLVQDMRMSGNTRTLLTLEAALGDTLAVVVVLFLIRYIKSPIADTGLQVSLLVSAFLWAGLLGGVGGVLWVRFLARVGRMPLSYMLTMAAILLLYAACEMIHASGVFAILVFGMAMTNAESIMKKMPTKNQYDWDATDFVLHDTIGWFHDEVTFIARVFFFVYLGMLLDTSGFTSTVVVASCGIVLLVYLTRYLATRIVGWLGRRQPPFERGIITGMAPRGLASAVLATLPSAAGIERTGSFIQYAIFVIVVTNVILTVSVFRSERRLEALIEPLTEEPEEAGDSGVDRR
ncbi:MAG: cation:proton antiporter [Candidatus Deferrimicrobiaceae bacterium]